MYHVLRRKETKGLHHYPQKKIQPCFEIREVWGTNKKMDWGRCLKILEVQIRKWSEGGVFSTSQSLSRTEILLIFYSVGASFPNGCDKWWPGVSWESIAIRFVSHHKIVFPSVFVSILYHQIRGERIVFSGPNTNTNTIRFQKCGRIRIRILFGFRNLAEYEYEYE